MKREFALAGIALVVSVLLSSPTFAETAQPQIAAAPAPAPIEVAAPAQAEELSIDDAIMMASTPEERAAVIRRCSGPPPRFMTPVKAEAPASEPAVPAE
ncbi:MAG: hypothetical protein ABMA14_03905 [Hyphomonadaceae bacterium]